MSLLSLSRPRNQWPAI